MRHAHGPTPESILKSESDVFRYDIPAWLEDDCPKEVLDFRCAEASKFRFTLSEENEKNLRAALAVWDYEPSSFSMLVRRVHNSWQIRTPERALAEQLAVRGG